ncbi:siroheme synthase CysG [Roseinatronobacter alkalisoli]|uniref:Siroheme synthase CysG n=1 Tax=Roseinatronobacter alkalisoli TaxID=3028235 RepID=A0ABT5TBT5_9RHOB|nr:siroheme synthase CysG [Roseinatronobacter sp. HJB301]MDD7972582.1 siroheme synthase CysG [Roseinatronobacter sp. HJB301]
MKTFPMFLQMTGRRVVIVGGGEQAAQKARLMLKTDAQIVLVAAVLDDELAAMVTAGRAVQVTTLSVDVFRGAALVFVGTGCVGLDYAAHALAKAAGAVVNVVDQPALCDAVTPSIVDRDPVVVAIGTEGTAPVLARQIKSRLEALLEPELGGFAALAGRLRTAVARAIPRAERRAFWDWAFDGPARAAYARGAARDAASLLKAAISEGGQGARPGRIALVGAGPGAADLLTLRAVRQMQQADVIFYDRLVDPSVLELARRDAERVFVGKEVGACAWPQDRINAVIIAAARQGKQVVRLKSGDPCIFGRATEELDAARAAGIAVEIIPGVTAASAAAASLGHALTERGQTDRLMLATATCQPGDPDPDWRSMIAPGTTLAVYMGVARAHQVVAGMRQAGVPMGLQVEIVAQASTPQERILNCVLGELPEFIALQAVENPAIILIRWPKLRQASLHQIAGHCA